MKTKITLALWLAVTPAVTIAAGAEAGQADPARFTARQSEKALKTPLAEVLGQIDAIDRETMDIQALYWAWDVKNTGRLTYGELNNNSRKWIMKPETRTLLMNKVKALLDNGKVRGLTPEEMNLFNAGRRRVAGLLAPGKLDTKLIAELSDGYCIDLQSRYWAKRVQDGEKEILELSKKWPLKKELKDKLRAAISEKLPLENANLTREELYKLDACIEKFAPGK
ncbi:MAG: hypothetical protein A2234_00720 [Elusimicrobia bacterium RIFOXYA2_FULL_58_8]|nr:MAG: hypothetical protein A2285_06155 [Elusimicrobia bacterium RIFOXYA12_FULL_57_11]OGS12202.1 MAG: hypothetical protein A2234_00720 [Elusimicrobia bacterium RIFOXYA2_FULL_58_8]